MNEKNYNYLRDSLKYLGFGESIAGLLAEIMKEGAKEFMLGHSATFNDKQIDASLLFRRSESSDLYFLNKWIGTVGQYEAARSQTFCIDKGHGVTLKEGFNLLEGRAVHKELTDKEGQSYKAWLQLDGKEKDVAGNYKVNQYHEKYGFDLERKLDWLPIKGLADPEQKAALVRSLQKGNLHTVTMEREGKGEAFLIAANPQFKSLNFYEQSGRQIPAHVVEKRLGVEPIAKKSPEVTILGKVGGAFEHGNSKSLNKEKKKHHPNVSQKPVSEKRQAAEQKGGSMSLEKKRNSKSKGHHL